MKLLNTLALITAFVLINTTAFSQTDNIAATAEVLADVSVTGERDIDFAVIDQDITVANPTIDPDNAPGDAAIIGTATVGVFHITGTAGQSISIGVGNFSPVQLVHGTNTDYAFDFTPALYGVPGELSTNARGTGGSDLSDTGDTDTLTDGEYTIYVGGALDNPVDNATGAGDNPTTALLAGDYTGTYTLTVDYE